MQTLLLFTAEIVLLMITTASSWKYFFSVLQCYNVIFSYSSVTLFLFTWWNIVPLFSRLMDVNVMDGRTQILHQLRPEWMCHNLWPIWQILVEVVLIHLVCCWNLLHYQTIVLGQAVCKMSNNCIALRNFKILM